MLCVAAKQILQIRDVYFGIASVYIRTHTLYIFITNSTILRLAIAMHMHLGVCVCFEFLIEISMQPKHLHFSSL